MDNSGKWKVITRPEEVVTPGIFQEKFVVICDRHDEGEANFKALEKLAREKGVEFTTLPPGIGEMIKRENKLAFAFWANKHNPVTTEKDLAQGNIRMQINK